MGQLVFQATLGGQVAVSGPNTASSYTLNLPTTNGNIVSTGDTGTVTNTMLASNVYTAPGTIGSGTPNTGAFTTLTASTSLTTPIHNSGASTALQLQSNGTTGLYMDTSQNVGIGTTSPARRLDVESAGTTYQMRIGDPGSASYTYDIGRDTATGYFRLYGNQSGANGYVFDGANGERMRIDSSGNLLVGTTSAIGINTMGIQMNVDGTGGYIKIGTKASGTYTIQGFYNASYNAGAISLNGNSTTYATSSDYRLKENVQPMLNALDTVAKLKPVTYDWKFTGDAGQGFIAHELQEVIPDAVTGEKDEKYEDGNPKYQGVDTSFLVATLTAAIQELKAIVDAQQQEINTLKGVK